MNTAIIGMGNIGARLAHNLASGGENFIVADRTLAKAQKLASELGGRTTAMSISDAIKKADIIIFAVYFDVIKALIAQHRGDLAGKIIVDPSNPVGPDGKGGFKKTIPADQSSGQIIAHLLPNGAKFVKAFGTLGADSLASASRRAREGAVLFYATDDASAGDTVARLITAAGFDPVKAGGVDQSIRIEVGGDLAQFGGLNGKLLTVAEAEALVGAEVHS